MAEHIDADIAALRNDLGQMRADFAKLSETLQHLGRHGAAEAMDKVMGSAGQAKEKIEKTGATLIHEIEERPVAAVVIAFIAGTILAALLGRRS
jgi:ElaB/YqjD/DUF883 family membrane-anchored ribosome-binding protein